MRSTESKGMSTLEYHVLLALASESLYGYAIKVSIESESAGTLTPRAGTLYRVLARLLTRGLVVDLPEDDTISPHPGLARRYYRLSPGGREALATESRRLRGAAALAERRLRLGEGRS